MPQTPKHLVWRGVEIHNPRTPMKIQSIVRPQDGTASCRNHTSLRLPGQFFDRQLLQVTKRNFALALEKLPDGAANSLFEHLIGIDKRERQTPRQLPPDS